MAFGKNTGTAILATAAWVLAPACGGDEFTSSTAGAGGASLGGSGGQLDSSVESGAGGGTAGQGGVTGQDGSAASGGADASGAEADVVESAVPEAAAEAPLCTAPLTLCKDKCLDTATDSANCGACEDACSTSHITPLCENGACKGACEEGFADCDQNTRLNGCEVSVKSDANNCGGCSYKCGDNVPCVQGRCQRLVFTTKAKVKGNLGNTGGVAAADAICKEIAKDAKLSGTFMAWISVSGSPAKTRLPAPKIGNPRYATVQGKVVAGSWSQFVSGAHCSMNEDENGTALPAGELAWTGTLAEGDAAQQNCENWTSQVSNYNGIVGACTLSDCNDKLTWTNLKHDACDKEHHLYCIQVDTKIAQ